MGKDKSIFENIFDLLLYVRIQNDLILRALYDNKNLEKANKIINDTWEKIINED